MPPHVSHCQWRSCLLQLESHLFASCKPISARRTLSTTLTPQFQQSAILRARVKPKIHHKPVSPPPPPPPPPSSTPAKILQSTPRKSPVASSNPKPNPNDPPINHDPRAKKWRTISLKLMALPIVIFSAYATAMYISLSRNDSPSSSSSTAAATTLTPNSDVSDRYDTIAPRFDLSVDSSESIIGITKLRRKLAALATGDVLEVSIGTGRNLSYYDWNFGHYKGQTRNNRGLLRGKVKSFTALDKSQQMLEVAHEKFMTDYPGILGVRWVIQDATVGALPGPPVSANERSGNRVDKGYDTIVQTMGLCSTPNPVALLRNMGEALEPNGKILLLEHGRSTWGWVNWVLDKGAVGHADRYGCWWNKDIKSIVEESGLEILEFKRKHFGTTYWVVLGRKGGVHVEERKPGPVTPFEVLGAWKDWIGGKLSRG